MFVRNRASQCYVYHIILHQLIICSIMKPEQIQDATFVLKSRTCHLIWLLNRLKSSRRCFNEESCVTVPDAEGYVMVLQPEEPKISLSGIDHFARSAAEFESQEGVTLFPELRIVSTITREVEADTESEAAEGADDDPTGKRNANGTLKLPLIMLKRTCRNGFGSESCLVQPADPLSYIH